MHDLIRTHLVKNFSLHVMLLLNVKHNNIFQFFMIHERLQETEDISAQTLNPSNKDVLVTEYNRRKTKKAKNRKQSP